jgi:hypothetical protein
VAEFYASRKKNIFLLLTIFQCRLIDGMQIVGRALYPAACVLYALKETVYAVVNRIALEIFTGYHWIRQDEKSKEIEAITNAINALEDNGVPDLKDFFSTLEPTNVELQITSEMLFNTLCEYRYNVISLYRGIKHLANQDVRLHIYNYVAPPGSVERTAQSRKPAGQLSPRDLSKEFE